MYLVSLVSLILPWPVIMIYLISTSPSPSSTIIRLNYTNIISLVNTVSSLGTYYHFLVAAISQRPLATGAMACYPLPFNTEWLNLFCALEAHLGGKAGDIDHLPPSMSSIPAAAAAAAANVPDATAVSSFAPAVAALDVDMEEVEEETGVVGGVMGSGSGVAGGSAGGSVGGSVGGGGGGPAFPQL
jgi:uncharacterized membrane protein YgcG